MRFSRATLALLLSALFVALSGTLLAAPHYFCHMAGRVVAHCCCTQDDAAPCEKTASQADCCERIDLNASGDVGGALRAHESVPPAALAATIADPHYLVQQSRTEREPIRRGRGPPAPERLFAVHCAFLI